MKRIAVILAVLCGFQIATAFTVPTTPTGYVNDYANILTAETKAQLEKELQLFAASTTNEIAVVTIPTLDGDTVEHYALKLFESWKIGKAKQDNGVLLLVAVNDHKLRIEVGYGLEGALPDILAKNIIDTVITPVFKNGDYDTGIVNGVTAIMQATFGEYTAHTASPLKRLLNGDTLVIIFFFVVTFFQFLSSILARSKSWWAGGVLGGIIGGGVTLLGLFGITFIVGGVVTIVLVLLGLLFDYIVSNTYNTSISRGGSVPWWIGGGSGSGGGSFGGFGGGSSGGGGASGSW